jgi:phosphotransferase system  glucose/maltose/N-acetylglucosamine-specific IIC component
MKRLYVIVIVLLFAALMMFVFTLFLKRYVEKKDATKLLTDKYT